MFSGFFTSIACWFIIICLFFVVYFEVLFLGLVPQIANRLFSQSVLAKALGVIASIMCYFLFSHLGYL